MSHLPTHSGPSLLPIAALPMDRKSTIPGTHAAAITAAAVGCITAGTLTLAVCLVERLGFYAGPALAYVSFGAIVGLISLSILEQRWHTRNFSGARVYTLAIALTVLAIVLGLTGWIITMPA